MRSIRKIKHSTSFLLIVNSLCTLNFAYGQESNILEIAIAHKISFNTDLNSDYQIQKSSDLSTWTDAGEKIFGNGSNISRYFDNTESRSFYRLSTTNHETPRQWSLPYDGDFENNDTIALNGPGRDRIAIFPINLGDSYIVSGEVKVDGYAGFVIGYNEALRRYASVYSGNGGTEIWKYIGQRRDYSTTLAHNWNRGSWVSFSIQREGTLYTIGIDGVNEEYILSGDEYGNQFGLLAQYDNRVEIRNLQYTTDGNFEPDPPTPPPSGNLVFLEATYGAEDSYTNVMSILEQNIVGNSISLVIGNHTMGGDPIFGVVKELRVRYLIGETEYQMSFPEGETLSLP